MSLDPRLEGVQVGRDVDRFWFAAVVPDLARVLWVEFTLDHVAGRCAYVGAWVGSSGPAVQVVDDELPWPRPERYLEVRGRGMWAQHVRETAFSHWSCGLEAVGLLLDDPAEGLEHDLGIPDGLTFDLEWEHDGAPVPLPDGYAQTARVHGDLAVVGREDDVDAVGARGRSWVGAGTAEAVVVLGGDRPDVVAVPTSWSGASLPRHLGVSTSSGEWSVDAVAHGAWRSAGRIASVAAAVATPTEGPAVPALFRVAVPDPGATGWS